MPIAGSADTLVVEGVVELVTKVTVESLPAAPWELSNITRGGLGGPELCGAINAVPVGAVSCARPAAGVTPFKGRITAGNWNLSAALVVGFGSMLPAARQLPLGGMASAGGNAPGMTVRTRSASPTGSHSMPLIKTGLLEAILNETSKLWCRKFAFRAVVVIYRRVNIKGDAGMTIHLSIAGL